MNKLVAALTVFALGWGFGQAPAVGVETAPEELAAPETVLDQGYFRGGTVSFGVSYKFNNSLIADATYVRPIITLDPLEFYNVASLRGTVADIQNYEYGAGVMTGLGLSYVGDEIALGAEARVWATAQYGTGAAFTPEFVLFGSFPSDMLFGD